MRFYLIILSYLKPISEVSKAIPAHREHLQRFYDDQSILFSGIQYSKTGGAIVMKTDSEEKLKELVEEDPFKLQGLAEYKVVGVEPRKWQACVEPWIQGE